MSGGIEMMKQERLGIGAMNLASQVRGYHTGLASGLDGATIYKDSEVEGTVLRSLQGKVSFQHWCDQNKRSDSLKCKSPEIAVRVSETLNQLGHSEWLKHSFLQEGLHAILEATIAKL